MTAQAEFGNDTLTTPTGPLRQRRGRWVVLRTKAGITGAVITAAILLLTIVGPFVTPFDYATTVGAPGSAPLPGHPLGLDMIGRDVLSRLLDGGRSTVTLAVVTTVVIYVIGVPLGLIAGYKRSFVDSILMRIVDILLSTPGLLIILLLCTGLGSSMPVLVAATALVLVPGLVRITRAATLEVASTGYIEASQSRGDSTAHILFREVLPNIRTTLIADLGLRFSWAIVLIGSINFLGVGLEQPTADWALMVSENRVVLATNPLAVAAPAVVLGLLIVGLNLVGDAYARSSGSSEA